MGCVLFVHSFSAAWARLSVSTPQNTSLLAASRRGHERSVDQAAARWARRTGLTFQGSSASRASAVLAFGSSSSRCSRYAYGSRPFTRAQATSEYRFALEAAP